MKIFPAIDLIDGCAVRLVKGDYAQKTVYSDNPAEVAKGFRKAGAEFIHIVDLDGAKSGNTDNFETIKKVIDESGLKVEIGGGIRDEKTIEKYISAGAYRVILGTAAITNPGFTKEMVQKYGEKIAVGADIKEGKVAIKGWLELSDKTLFDFCRDLEDIGVKTLICTDISKDGMLGGTNIGLYKELSEKFNIDIVASGGISTLSDIKTLSGMKIAGAILGKALYTGALDLAEAIKTAGEVK
ncbi:MAG: 1-(5-phosphoribosyl)-5-[Firmicutes bacterium]|nr:1-(5-phosphoribosyl)-5-[(5-phosphoribosylamino)methylideneamino]imidazole-4-carboxamide isomerase [Bacillota bacterium]